MFILVDGMGCSPLQGRCPSGFHSMGCTHGYSYRAAARGKPCDSGTLNSTAMQRGRAGGMSHQAGAGSILNFCHSKFSECIFANML
jgi:hypothetical protein